jgi:acetylornithine deacetylase/succinyl-diaminopimelate desuccinylase-like protein
MADIETALNYVREHRDAHQKELIEVLSIPSVSTLAEHKPDIERCANWLADQLRRLNLDTVEIKPTGGHPIVYGEWLQAGADKPTVLVYGHYDVQPADPFDEWDSPPFDPEIRDDYIYARGASDMKGQIFAQIKAAEAMANHGGLPFNIKYLIEGEEEIGSENLEAFIDKNVELLKCDFVLNTDAGIYSIDQPGITYSLRGLAYFEVEVRGPSKDLHSGRFGGTVRNPIHVLSDLISGMHDDEGRVTLPGFYDKVREVPGDERAALAALPYEDEHWKEMSASKALYGEKGYFPLEQIGIRPCLDVNGIWSGFTGEGAKTVLPSVATCKLSTRLVAHQVHTDIPAMLNAYMEANVPEGIDWEVRDLGGGPAATMDRHSKWMTAAEDALRESYNKDTLFSPEGGSIPVIAMMQQKLGVDSIMLGFSLPDDGIHGPNERQYMPNFFLGIETYIRYMGRVAETATL